MTAFTIWCGRDGASCYDDEPPFSMSSSPIIISAQCHKTHASIMADRRTNKFSVEGYNKGSTLFLIYTDIVSSLFHSDKIVQPVVQQIGCAIKWPTGQLVISQAMHRWHRQQCGWHTLSVARGYGRPDRCRPTFTVNALRPPYASASPAPPRALPHPRDAPQHATLNIATSILRDPSGRSYETQLASLFRERQAFRLYLQHNLESIIRIFTPVSITRHFPSENLLYIPAFYPDRL
ncbi:hypothetical protein HW555_004751 [Spodoptera exigua]|uniref:Uncharacterized protein n=1 Tax=Spodoptera exigua TaxID=7107 RepID=A0A835GJ62_SPOEX|nr:hypothetical protein HW555_004751 [Spodoptera exigua]